MKNIVVKTISIILVFSLIISSVPIPSVYAADKGSYLDVIKEAMGDASSDNPAGDWATAIFKDGLHWGDFHYAVQNHIIANNPSFGKELPIRYKNGKKGRADIYYYSITEDVTYLWEVKPLSCLPPIIT